MTNITSASSVTTSDQSAATAPSLARVDDLMSRNDWAVLNGSPNREDLARSLDTLDRLNHSVPEDFLLSFAGAVRDVVDAEAAASAAGASATGSTVIQDLLSRKTDLAQLERSHRALGYMVIAIRNIAIESAAHS